MTDFFGVNHTLAYRNDPQEKVPVGEQRGNLRIAFDEIDLASQAALTTSDTVKFMRLPLGARVMEATLASVDVGSTGDANLGWDGGTNGLETADADGFLTAVDLNAAAIVHKMTDEANIPGQFKKFIDEVTVEMVPTETFTATSGFVRCAIQWINE